MIGQLHGENIFNVVELRNEIDLFLDRFGLNNGHYLSIPQHTMYFNAFECRNPERYGIAAAIKTTDYNS